MSALSFPILTAEGYRDATNRAKALIHERVEAPSGRTSSALEPSVKNEMTCPGIIAIKWDLH
jgi:hypothetical protein